MKKFAALFMTVVFLVSASLSSGARDPGNGPFPLLIGDKIWTSADGKIAMTFKESKNNPKQMDLFISSDCKISYFGTTESVRRLDEDTFVIGIRDHSGQLWYGLFQISEKRQMMQLILTNGDQDLIFGANSDPIDPKWNCL